MDRFLTAPIIYGMLFLAVLLLVEAIYLLAFGKSINLNNRMNRRLELMKKGNDRAVVMERLRKEMDQYSLAQSIPLFSGLARKAQIANLAFSPMMLVVLMVLLALAGFVGLAIGTDMAAAPRIVAATVLSVGGVYAWVNRKAKKRMDKLEEQLPDAIELMVRSLRVGQPLSASIGAVAREIPDPIGTEFGVIADEMAYGGQAVDAINELAARMNLQDLRFLAISVAIQQQSGGNLADILDGLSKVIRARFKLFRRVRAITAEAKWSGAFLSFFPIGAIVMLAVIKPDYYDGIKDTGYYVPGILLIGTLMIMNFIFMRVMVNIKV